MEEKLSETFAIINDKISTKFIVYVKCGTVKIV
jgi:hypothetical protein